MFQQSRRLFTRGPAPEARPRGEVADHDLTMSPRTLRFSRPVSARYEIDTGRERARHLRRAILIGLVVHNGFGLTTALLVPWTIA